MTDIYDMTMPSVANLYALVYLIFQYFGLVSQPVSF